MRVVIEHTFGARAGERQVFENPQVVHFGRHPSSEVQFDAYKDLDASARHAELRVEGGRAVLVDVGSSNGTLVAGERLSGERVLQGGEEIQFGTGGPRVRIVLEGASVPATVASPPVAPPAGVRTTVFKQAVESAVERATRPLRALAIGLSILLAVAAAGLIAYRARSEGRDEEVRRKMVALMEQQRSASDAEKAELQKKLDEAAAQLRKSTGGSAIAKTARGGIYLVALKTPWGQEQGFCTAFAIEPQVLVTNSHCVAVAEEFQQKGAHAFVVQNGHPETRFDVVAVKKHPAWKQTLRQVTADVGLLRISGTAPQVLPMASDEELRKLAPGDVIFLYGFPGRLADVKSPEATIVQGVIGRMTRLSGEAAPFEEAKLVQHSAFTSGGTSGSPIFDADGQVIAVNAGGYVESGTMKVMDPSSGHAGEVVVAKNLTGYNFGMRIDLVRELLELVK